MENRTTKKIEIDPHRAVFLIVSAFLQRGIFTRSFDKILSRLRKLKFSKRFDEGRISNVKKNLTFLENQVIRFHEASELFFFFKLVI